MNEEMKNTDAVETEDISETTTTESSEEEKVTINPQDYSVIRDMLKEMDDWNKMLKDETHSILKNNYGLTNFSMLGIIPYTDEKIESMTLEEINAFIEKYRDPNVKNIPEINTVEEGVTTMKELKNLQMNLYSAEQETAKLKGESQEILNDYFEYLSSPEVVAARKSRLDKMRELAENETDEVKKSRMNMMIDSMEQADNMEFIFKRFYNDVTKETESVLESFFNEKKGSYVIDSQSLMVKLEVKEAFVKNWPR